MSVSYCLIAVDVQYDFLPGGALAVPDGDQTLAPLVTLMHYAELTVASRDWHPKDHFSFDKHPQYVDGSWPPHCVQKTKGAKIHPSVRKYADFTISKGMNRNPPDAFSAFAGKTLRPVRTLEEILQGSPLQAVVVGGLALDYCVQYTAFDSSSLGYHTIVPLDATRGVAPNTSQDAINKLRHAGVEVVDHFDPTA